MVLEPERLAQQLSAVLALRDRAAFTRLLAPGVRWGGREDTEQTCHDSQQAGDFYGALLAAGTSLSMLSSEAVAGDRVLVHLDVSGTEDESYQARVLLTVRDGLVSDILQLEDDAPLIELLFFAGCPHYEAFLPHLQQLLAEHDIYSPVQLVEVLDEQQAERLHFLGSPSLRINGVDVEPGAGERTGYGMQCRIYSGVDGHRGVPADAWLLQVLRADGGPDSS